MLCNACAHTSTHTKTPGPPVGVGLVGAVVPAVHGQHHLPHALRRDDVRGCTMCVRLGGVVKGGEFWVGEEVWGGWRGGWANPPTGFGY